MNAAAAHRPHHHPHAASGAPLKLAVALTACVALFELAGGIAAHSLALVSDAAHVFMDVVALGIALAAQLQVARPANARQTYGFARLEILAAAANAILLLAVTVLIVAESIVRLIAPQPSSGVLMAAVAAAGLVVNVCVGVLLAGGREKNLNLRAAVLHVAGDALGSLAVVLGGVAIALFGIERLDPALSLVVSAIILGGVWRVLRDAANVLLESAPAHAAVPLVRARIRRLDGVVDVHDLHVWSIGSGSHVLSAHVLLPDKQISEASAILHAIEEAMRDEFAIDHVTIQFECESCEADDRIVCTQPRTK